LRQCRWKRVLIDERDIGKYESAGAHRRFPRYKSLMDHTEAQFQLVVDPLTARYNQWTEGLRPSIPSRIATASLTLKSIYEVVYHLIRILLVDTGPAGAGNECELFHQHTLNCLCSSG
jgi:hypothetical protein